MRVFVRNPWVFKWAPGAGARGAFRAARANPEEREPREPVTLRRGYSLIELIVTIGCLAILFAITSVAVMRAREQGSRTECQNNLRTMGTAAHGCEQVMTKLPPAWGKLNGFGTGLYFLLPYTDSESVFRLSKGHIDNTVPDADGKQQFASSFIIPFFLCPDDVSGPDEGMGKHGGLGQDVEIGSWGFSNYAMNFQVFGNPDMGNRAWLNMQGQSRFVSSFADGTSHTILFVEKYRRCGDFGSLWGHGSWSVPWMSLVAYGDRRGTQGYSSFSVPPGVVGPGSIFQVQPNPWQTACNPSRAASAHSGGINVGMADGSVRYISVGILPEIWWALYTPANGDSTRGDY
jgi:prepilin-type processing-associated H-X9-DG protein/prepilin-type N-terminal cleavage/methylation domain-containing protein